MSKKSDPEMETEEGAERPKARKTAVRKTIRRVRKATTRREKEPTEAQDEKPEDKKGSEPEKAARERPEASREEKSGREATRDREDRMEGDKPKRKIGRGRKSAGDEENGESDDRGTGGGERRGRGRRGKRPKSEQVDTKELSRKAWKLYHADIAEEGIALVDDKAGRHLALRSYDLARIFLEEKARQERENKGTGDNGD